MKRTTTPLSELKAKLADSRLSHAKFVSDGVGIFYVPRGGWRKQVFKWSAKRYDEYDFSEHEVIENPDAKDFEISTDGKKLYTPSKYIKGETVITMPHTVNSHVRSESILHRLESTKTISYRITGIKSGR